MGGLPAAAHFMQLLCFFLLLSAGTCPRRQTDYGFSCFCLPEPARAGRRITGFPASVCRNLPAPADRLRVFLLLSAGICLRQQTNHGFSCFCLPEPARAGRRITGFPASVCRNLPAPADGLRVFLLLSAGIQLAPADGLRVFLLLSAGSMK